MEPHCSCHVRAASFLLPKSDVIYLFVSATASLHARLPTIMELAKRFEEARAYASVSVSSLEPPKPYPITTAKRISTKYGLAVLLTLRGTDTGVVQVILPQRYSHVMTDSDLDSINSKALSLNLVYKVICDSSNAYLFAIES